MGSVLLPCPRAIKSVLGAKTSRTRPSKTKIRRGPGGEANKMLPILPQISTYFAGIMPVANRYRLCQLLCRQIRLKPIFQCLGLGAAHEIVAPVFSTRLMSSLFKYS